MTLSFTFTLAMFAMAELTLRTSCRPEALPSGTTRLEVKVWVSVTCA
jgi:hypothetical protein